MQAEAPSLGKPVLVMRDVTERTEGIDAGTAKIVGTKRDRIIGEVSQLLNDRNEYDVMAKSVNPYGDGKASRRIREILGRYSEIAGRKTLEAIKKQSPGER